MTMPEATIIEIPETKKLAAASFGWIYLRRRIIAASDSWQVRGPGCRGHHHHEHKRSADHGGEVVYRVKKSDAIESKSRASGVDSRFGNSLL